MDLINSILKKEEVQFIGAGTILVSIIGGIANYITQMEVINPILVTISSILGIAFLWYKLKIIHLDYVERKEARKKQNLPVVKFRWRFWKFWNRKK